MVFHAVHVLSSSSAQLLLMAKTEHVIVLDLAALGELQLEYIYIHIFFVCLFVY